MRVLARNEGAGITRLRRAAQKASGIRPGLTGITPLKREPQSNPDDAADDGTDARGTERHTPIRPGRRSVPSRLGDQNSQYEQGRKQARNGSDGKSSICQTEPSAPPKCVARPKTKARSCQEEQPKTDVEVRH